jgi:leader peptidase (prepilin peptidase)/N-methyltransferase
MRPADAAGNNGEAGAPTENHSAAFNVTAGAIAIVAAAASIALVPGARGWLGAGLALLMLAIAAIDARRFIIPNELNAAGLLLALPHAVLAAPDATVIEAIGMALLRGVVLALMFLVLRAAYLRLRRLEGVGLGDVKLAAVAGAWLGWNAMPIAVQIAALSALAVYGLRHFVGGQPMQATSRIPFGLFLAPAIWLAWLIEATLLL